MTQTHVAQKKRLRVLVVDDNLDQVHTMAYLVADMGHHVDYAINGIVALEMAQRLKPDVVLLDVGLPDTSGFHLVRQVRLDPGLRETYVIGVTGLNVDRTEALTRGFDELLTKPLDIGGLELALHRRRSHS